MRETWRWFGPGRDAITLAEVAQTGAAGIVTALHDLPPGAVWSADAITSRRDEIAAAGLCWDVVESLPVADAIKRGDGDLAPLFAAYRQSLVNLAAAGLRIVCYNFMPVLDWTRTDLAAPVAGGGTCLQYSAAKMAAFELYLLEREEAQDDYPADTLSAAAAWVAAADDKAKADLVSAVCSGLPGGADGLDLQALRRALSAYAELTHADLRANLSRFLDEVIPTATELGMSLCIHPDDPPRDILGLPRIVSTEADIAKIMTMMPDAANGLTLCTGSLGARPDNDLASITRRFGDRVPFAHLRNVTREDDGSFAESAHLGGDVDMVSVIDILLETEARNGRSIPYRADHGHALLSDASLTTQPGYPLIGRLRGLAELRGVVHALS